MKLLGIEFTEADMERMKGCPWLNSRNHFIIERSDNGDLIDFIPIAELSRHELGMCAATCAAWSRMKRDWYGSPGNEIYEAEYDKLCDKWQRVFELAMAKEGK